MTKAGFYFSKIQEEEIRNNENIDLIKLNSCLIDFIQVSESLNYLHIYVRSGNMDLIEDLTHVSDFVKCYNWSLEFKSEIVLPRGIGRNVR